MRNLASIVILYRAADSMSLYGIPYEMRADVGQQPADLARAGNTHGWIYLGGPGWWGSLTPDAIEQTRAWLSTLPAGAIPEYPNEWTHLEDFRNA